MVLWKPTPGTPTLISVHVKENNIIMTTSTRRRIFASLPAAALALSLGISGTCLAEHTLPRAGAFGPAATPRSTTPEALANTHSSTSSASQSSTAAHPRNNIPL